MSNSRRDSHYMALALRLAAKGRGLTNPNPMVGAVVVARGRVIGSGYHRRPGGPHAEVIALQQAGQRARGATLFVTLEPCSHINKRTPPCVPAVLASGVRRVVVAMPDPNPQVSGGGLRQLRRSGLTVDVGCLRDQAERLNESYCHWVVTRRPFVLLKAAMTLDGKIATKSGESQWITGPRARRHVHQLRSRVDAVMVGIGTVLRDDPQLSARFAGGQPNRLTPHQPLRVIMDGRLRIPLTAKVLARSSGQGADRIKRINTLIATTSQAPKARLHRLRSLGIPVLVLPAQDGHPSLRACLQRLGQMGITSVMIEGGSELNASALRDGMVNRVLLYVAPLLLGGQDAKGIIGGRSPNRLASARRLQHVQIRRVGGDFLMEGSFAGTPPTRRRKRAG